MPSAASGLPCAWMVKGQRQQNRRLWAGTGASIQAPLGTQAARPAQVARAAATAAQAEDGRGTPLVAEEDLTNPSPNSNPKPNPNPNQVAEEDLPTFDGTLPAPTSPRMHPSPTPTN